MKCLGNTAKGKLRLDRGIAGLDLGDNSSISVLYIPLVPQIPKMIPSICNEAILMTPLPSVQNSSTAGSSLAAVYHRRLPLLTRERWFQKTAEKGTVTTGLSGGAHATDKKLGRPKAGVGCLGSKPGPVTQT